MKDRGERRASVRQREGERMQRQECALHPNVTGSLSRSTSEDRLGAVKSGS
jgi:hypothetical protein